MPKKVGIFPGLFFWPRWPHNGPMRTPSEKPHTPHRQRKRLKTFVIALLALYVLYAVVAYFAVPHITSSTIRTLAEKHVNSEFQANTIRFNPFNLSLQIQQPRLIDRTDGTAWWQAESVTTNMDGIASAISRNLVLDELKLDQPQIRLERTQDGHLRYPRLSLASDENSDSPPFRLRIKQLAIEGGRVQWQDDTGSQSVSVQLKRVDYHHQGFNTGTTPSHFNATLETADGARLNLNGSYVHQNPAVDAQWEVNLLNLPQWMNKLHMALPGLSLQQALVSGSGSLRWQSRSASPGAGFIAEELTLKDVRLGVPLEPLDLEGSAKPGAGSDKAEKIAPVLQAPAIVITGASLNPQKKHLSIDRIGLDQARLHAPLHVLETVEKHSPTASNNKGEATKATATPPYSWEITDVSLSNSELQVESAADNTGPDLGIKSLRLQNLSDNDQPASLTAELTLPGESGQSPGTARLSGAFSLATGTVELSHQLEHASVHPWLPVLQDYLLVSNVTGVLDSQGRWQWQRGAEDSTGAFSGTLNASLTEFTLADKTGKTVLAWDKASLGETQVDGAKRRLRLGPSHTPGPASEVRLADTGNNLEPLLPPPARSNAGESRPDKNRNKAKAGTKKAQKPWHIELGTASVSDGQLGFIDARLQPPFHLQAAHLKGAVTAGKAGTGKGPTNFTVQAELDKFTRATAKGQLRLNNNPVAPQAQGGIRNLDLSRLSAYAQRYLGYAIKSGKADVDINYRIRDQRLQGELDLTIVKLKLDKASGNTAAMQLPLKTALALLTDGNGVTRLRIPFQGDLTDPNFSIGHLVVKAFVNVITGVTTSPFKILAKLTGLGKENLRQILFDPGDDALRATESAKLQKLALALKKRPAVGLRLTGLANRPRDSQALRYKKLLADLALPESTQEDNLPKLLLKDTLQDRLRRQYTARLGFARWAQLQEQYGADPVKLSMVAWQELLESTVVDENDLVRLASNRASTVSQYLQEAEGMPSDRLSLAKPVIDDKKPPQVNLDILPLD